MLGDLRQHLEADRRCYAFFLTRNSLGPTVFEESECSVDYSVAHPRGRSCGSPFVNDVVPASTWATPPTQHGVVGAADPPHHLAPRTARDHPVVELQRDPAIRQHHRPAVP